MCGRFTYKLTWPEIVKLYRLSLDTPARNPQARHNICPTTTVDTVIGRKGLRALVPMRWGLIPSWWSKPLKEMKLATFNARVETITDNPMFRKAFKHTRRLIPASGYYAWHDTPRGKQPLLYATRRRGDHHRGLVGRVARPTGGRDNQVARNDHHGHQRVRGRAERPDAGDP